MNEGIEGDDPETIYKILLQNNDITVATFYLKKTELHHCHLFASLAENSKEIPLSENHIDLKSLVGAVEYIKHHKDDPIELPMKPLRSKHMSQLWKDPWDVNFIENIYKDSMESLCKMANAANYLHIDGLLHLCITKMATLIKGIRLTELENIMNKFSQYSQSSEIG